MNEKIIWDFLKKAGFNDYSIAGIMGNLQAESNLSPINLQNSGNKKLNMTDEEYTEAVDNGEYTNFARDGFGYGIAQFTHSSKKLNLFSFAKTKNKSVGDLVTQLEFLLTELNKSTSIMTSLKNSNSVKESSNVILLQYERPADQSKKVQEKRASMGQKFYDKYAEKEIIIMANKYDKYINSTDIHYIANSGSDENKKYNSGKAGDQTGNEWEIRKWYSRPWTHVFRYDKDKRVGETLCRLSCDAASNDNIGYDQWQRNTYWTQLQKVGYEPSKIITTCEQDCSAGTAANIKATGYLLGIPDLQNVSSGMNSRNTVDQLTKAGFTVLTESKYLTSGKYLMPGDVLLYVNHHVAVNVTKGTKSENYTPAPNVKEEFETIGTATALVNMHIRSEASSTGSSYGAIKKGSTVEVIEKLDNGWYKIIWDKAPVGYAYTSNRTGKFYTFEEKKQVVSSDGIVALNKPVNTNESYKGNYKITGAKVNVRHGAGTTNKVMVVIPKNTKVTCDGRYTRANIDWLYCRFIYKSLTFNGFISSKYLEKV